MAFAAAQGYPQYAELLNGDVFSRTVLADYYSNAIFPNIVNTSMLSEIRSVGDTIYFMRTPGVRVRSYVKNQVIEHDNLEPSKISLSIDRMNDYSVKIDDVDMKRYPQVRSMVSNIRRTAAIAMADHVDRTLLNEAYLLVDPANTGANAGVVSGNINLGSPGNPLVVTDTNIIDLFAAVSDVLGEQNVPMNDWYAVLPFKARNLLLKAYQDASVMGLNQSPSVTGQLGFDPFGFKTYTTTRLTPVIDPVTNTQVYHAIFGSKEAIALASDIIGNRVVSEAPHAWGQIYQGLQVWGFGVIRPEALVHVYMQIA